jgi:N-methylhydantoinase B/oxoprolinase/acetone carboxylase alpha subunit
VEEAIEVLRAWLPPMGMTSIPEKPIKPAQANELHRAVRALADRIEDLEAQVAGYKTATDQIEAAWARGEC